MPLKPESIKVDPKDAQEALGKARKTDPEMNLSRLIRKLLREYLGRKG